MTRPRVAAVRLHEMLLRVARAELRGRSATLRIAGPELDDLAHQAAADAVVAVLAKVATFRSQSRFTTWAYRFVILEVSSNERPARTRPLPVHRRRRRGL